MLHRLLKLLWFLILPIFALLPLSLFSSSSIYNGLTVKKTSPKELIQTTKKNSSTIKYSEKHNRKNTIEKFRYPMVFDLSDADKEWIEETISKMSLQEKCGQMVMPWVLGNFISEDSKEYKRLIKLVKEQKVGGLIFFRGDVLNQALIINKMQKLAKVPLLIAADFERGLGMRLRDGLEFPYNMALAATGNLTLAYKMGKIIAEETKALGVHQNYAPIADVNNNPDNPIINIRSFSEDKEIVARFNSAFIAGTNSEKILSTSKHFPGHGNTQIDSHKDMPRINIDRLNLANNELFPFMESINANVKSIMVGHLNVPALDPENIPATLSKKIITDLLKEEMRFDGLIVTDAMNMSAITKYYSAAEAAVLAVEAGIDLVLMPPDEEIAINAIASAVKDDRISQQRIDESVRKILSAKRWVDLENSATAGRFVDIINLPKVLGNKSHLNLAQEIADKSITLVKNENNIIPINPLNIHKAASITLTDGIGNESEKIFQNQLSEHFRSVSRIILNNKSTSKDYKRAMDIAKNSDLILLPSFIRVKAYQGTVSLSKQQIDFINKIIELKTPAVLISFGNPYLLSLFSEASTYLCAYGDVPVSQTAMLRAIIGEIDIQGRLPISIPNTEFTVGDGIKLIRKVELANIKP